MNAMPHNLPDDWVITPQEVAKLLNNGGTFHFIDCRTADEADVAKIDGATLIPMQDLDLHLPAMKQYKDQLVVVHCHKGKRSNIVTIVLRNEGFSNVKSMAGGIDRWSQEIDPNVPRY